METPVTLSDIMNELKAVHRDLRRIKQKMEDPDGAKAKARSDNSTFKRPMNVSEKLQKFLKLEQSQQVSRADVSKLVNEYIKTNNLKNGSVIVPDAALQEILQVPDDALPTLTSLKLTKYLSQHFVKTEAPAAAEPPPKTPARPKVRAAA